MKARGLIDILLGRELPQEAPPEPKWELIKVWTHRELVGMPWEDLSFLEEMAHAKAWGLITGVSCSAWKVEYNILNRSHELYGVRK